ncbi:MAG: Fur family transcriptional regulator [Sulfurimonas sp.]|nr:Fur family transcriptional regulator [Sulfurimonas sp.]MDD3059895.1 Fur family transcriptional regulator [Sulfurimonas sp.]MDD5201781.1 Fur family transcriptional regulator [Sulfurimonas sp.]
MNNYTQMLRNHNLKATPQRLAIVDMLYMHGHMSIDALYEVMIKRFSSISLATIYKNINLMLENTFIQEVKLPNFKSVYELTKESHSHTMCEKCGKINDINLDLDAIVNTASTLKNFEITKADLVLSGVCKNCV